MFESVCFEKVNQIIPNISNQFQMKYLFESVVQLQEERDKLESILFSTGQKSLRFYPLQHAV